LKKGQWWNATVTDVTSGLHLERGESVLVGGGGGGGARFCQRGHCICYGLPKWPAAHKL